MTVVQSGKKDAPAEIIMQGQMAKVGENLKKWKTRWFVLYADSSRAGQHNKAAIAWRDKKGGKVKGGILFEDATLVRDASPVEELLLKKEHCIVVELPHRHYVFSAASLEEKDAWKAAIAKILLYLGKDPDAVSQPPVPKAKMATPDGTKGADPKLAVKGKNLPRHARCRHHAP